MLKVPAPNGESPGASLFAFEKMGRVYNPNHGRNQVANWDWNEEVVDQTIGEYWRRLNKIDKRFSLEGMSHVRPQDFLPLKDVVDKLGGIREAMVEAIENIHIEERKALFE